MYIYIYRDNLLGPTKFLGLVFTTTQDKQKKRIKCQSYLCVRKTKRYIYVYKYVLCMYIIMGAHIDI